MITTYYNVIDLANAMNRPALIKAHAQFKATNEVNILGYGGAAANLLLLSAFRRDAQETKARGCTIGTYAETVCK